MSYPLDVDEIEEDDLFAELLRREKARSDGYCDYCNRKSETTPCKFPARHKNKSVGPTRYQR